MLVWVISIFYAYGALSTVFSYAIVFAKAFPATAAQRQYFAAMTAFDHALTAFVVLLNLGAAVLLFRLRRQAPPIFTFAFAVGVGTVVYQILTTNWLEAVGIFGLVGAAIGWAINVAVIVYTWTLRKRGVLA